MQDIRKLLAILAVLALSVAACGGGGSQPTQEETGTQTEEPATEPATTEPASEAAAPEAPIGEHTIVVEAGSFAFTPASLTVPAGTTVTWENREDLPITHTVTSGEPPGTSSGVFNLDLTRGQSVEFTFAEAGTFPYYCNFHRQMTGEIVVQ